MSFTPEFKIGSKYYPSVIVFATEVETLAYAGEMLKRYGGAVVDYRAVKVDRPFNCTWDVAKAVMVAV